MNIIGRNLALNSLPPLQVKIKEKNINTTIVQITGIILLSFFNEAKNTPTELRISAGINSCGKSSLKSLTFIQNNGGVHFTSSTNGTDQKADRKNPTIKTEIIYLAVFQLLFRKRKLGTMTRIAINVIRCVSTRHARITQFNAKSRSNLPLFIPLQSDPRKINTNPKLIE